MNRSFRQHMALTLAAMWITVLPAGAAWADDDDFRGAPLDPLYLEECGACHVAFPPALLSQRSWGAVADGLADHFGTDASLDPETLQTIRRYLDDNAGRRRSDGADGRPLLRITDTRWFRKEHRPGEHGLRSDTFSRPEVGSAANCAACHRGAEEGRYGEREIRIPTPGSAR
ncbi:MAG: diheme cytochrome c [Rhodocyclaceae bacterium]|nr:diheme cytochrome c [Rhodocyclaceae bacterium]